MAADQISFSTPKTTVTELSSTVITVQFRNRATQAAVVPTTVKYRIDDLNNGVVVSDWTSVTPASSVSITVTPTQNQIYNDYNGKESRQFTVKTDDTLSTQYIDSMIYTVKNLAGIFAT